MYNEEVMRVYDLYFKCVAEGLAENMGDDDALPMSGVRVMPKEAYTASTEGKCLKCVCLLLLLLLLLKFQCTL
jgi:hypothetical protein